MQRNNKNVTTLCKTKHIKILRDFTFIQLIKANCIWRICAHDSSNPLRCYPWPEENKRVEINGNHAGSECWRIPPLSANGADKRKRSLPLFSWVRRRGKVRRMRSATVSKRIIRRNLWSDASEPGRSAVLKNHYTEPDFSGQLWRRSAAGDATWTTPCPKRPWMKHFLITPVRSLIESWRTGQEELMTFSKTHCTVCPTAATLYGGTASSAGIS